MDTLLNINILVWHNKCSNENAISEALDYVDWNLFFYKNLNAKSVFLKTLMNVSSNFIANKFVVTFSDKDTFWITSKLKDRQKWKNCMMIFVTQSKTGTMVKRVPQEQMVGVRSYPSRELFSPLFRVCHVSVV